MPTDKQFDGGEFRHALGSFTTGVTVVTTRGTGGEDIGLTANSFNSVSLDPPMVLWSLGKSAMSMPHFKAADYFAVHVLSQDQELLSTRFAKRGEDKFAGLDVQRGLGGVPLLPNCAARFICKTAYQYEGGDHIIFVGEVTDFSHWETPPLLFHRGQYGQINREVRAELPSGDEGAFQGDALGYLLRLCSAQIFAPVRDELFNRNLTLPQYYVLALIAKFDPESRSKLMELLEFGDVVPSAEELDELEVRGLIASEGGRVSMTPTGSRLHMELASIYKASESAAMSVLDFEMQQLLTIALQKLIEKTRHPG